VYFALSPEQRELQENVTRFVNNVSPLSRVRDHLFDESRYDEETWRLMNSQMALAGLIIPERFGGSGASQMESILVFEALGSSLACVPYLATVALAVNLLMASGDESAQSDYLPRIAAGAVATFAYSDRRGEFNRENLDVNATRNGPDWLLDGEHSYVLDGATADVMFVSARSGDGVSVLAVEATASGLDRVPVSTMDQSRKQAKLKFNATPARLIGAEGCAETWITTALAWAAISLAAEQVGGARRCLEMAVEYAKSRVQFDRAIGSFQAIKHKCADVLIEVESAQAATHHAAWMSEAHPEVLPKYASMVKAYASDAYELAAEENMQIHGGMGFTWECDAHLYLKRARTSSLLFGSPAYHRERLATCIGL
jgi:alkylation response protein AidB-like acyl-CoA dehydrogenase